MKTIIKRRRHDAGLTQEDVARHLSLSIAQYSRLERHPERARVEQLSIIATVLGCSIADLQDGVPGVAAMASIRRTVPLYSLDKSEWSGGQRQQLGSYAPTTEVSAGAYAVEAIDDDLSNNGRRSIHIGDEVLVDPAVTPNPGDIVHALDPQTNRSLLRIFSPLHPSNARAPGFLLKATSPSIDDIFVPGGQTGTILGVVTEVRTEFRRT